MGQFRTQALLSTGLGTAPAKIVEWFVLHWQLEVTFQEVRAHLGVETQRQWSGRAIARTTPALLGLFSWVSLASHLSQKEGPDMPRPAAWYTNPLPTFAHAIALVRRELWQASGSFSVSESEPEIAKVPTPLFNRLIGSLAPALEDTLNKMPAAETLLVGLVKDQIRDNVAWRYSTPTSDGQALYRVISTAAFEIEIDLPLVGAWSFAVTLPFRLLIDTDARIVQNWTADFDNAAVASY